MKTILKSKLSKKIIFIFYTLTFFALPPLSIADMGAGALPKDWYRLPEEDSLNELKSLAADAKTEKDLSLLMEKILKSNQNALEKLPLNHEIPLETDSLQTFALKPTDWTPWHLEYLTTDLAITLQGLVGILTIRATPSMQTYWRRQGPRPTVQLDQMNTVNLMDPSNSEDITHQIEPVIQAAIASGQVKDPETLRENLRNTAKELENMIQSLDTQPHSEWWPSRFRFDFLVSAQGHIIAPVYAGGELRFRFEWKRIQRKVPQALHTTENPSGLSQFKISLEQFVETMENALADASADSPAAQGFEASQFRVGLGVTAGGNIGLAAGSTQVLGHLYFSRDAKKPVVYPIPDLPKIKKRTRPILIIEDHPAPSHLAFARRMGLAHHAPSQNWGTRRNPGTQGHSGEQVVYEVGPEKMAEGLRKALKMGSFFAKQGATANQGQWKVYMMNVYFDLSITGNFVVAAAGGLASTGISFYNQNF